MNILKKHYKLISKIAGIICFIGGGILTYLGFADFVGSVINNVSPSLFACSVSGIILLTFSVLLLILGFSSHATVYITDESLDGEEVNHSAECLSYTSSTQDVASHIMCPYCNTTNDPDSKFCKSCGNKL